MTSNYPDHDPDESVEWKKEGEQYILKPRGLFIRWGNSPQYWRLPQPNQDGPAELLQVSFIEVSATKEIDLTRSYKIGFRVSLSKSWNPCLPVIIMAKKEDGNYIARKETFEDRPVGGEEFDIPNNFVIRFPRGEGSSKPILHITLIDQWNNQRGRKRGLRIHYAFVKEEN